MGTPLLGRTRITTFSSRPTQAQMSKVIMMIPCSVDTPPEMRRTISINEECGMTDEFITIYGRRSLDVLYFHRTQVSLRYGLWVPVSLSLSLTVWLKLC